MPDQTELSDILLQFVIVQRDQVPSGWRVRVDGRCERTTADNALPSPTERLDRDWLLEWQAAGTLSADELSALQNTIRESGFFNLQPKLLINYCKEDPGVAIWQISIDGQQARVVVYDPKPKRAPEIDQLNAALRPFINRANETT